MPKGIPREDSAQRKIIHRYKIAQGHLNKVIKMLENGEYCIHVVHQSLAVQSALKAADEVVLKNHLESCVADSIKKGESKAAIAEMMEVIKKR
jgi:CsoR family transcriptional regulator, copper-sensing transcriptional repressor